MSRHEWKILLTLGGAIAGFLVIAIIMFIIAVADRFNMIFTLPVYFAILLLITYVVRRRPLSTSMLIMVHSWRTNILGGFVGVALSAVFARNEWTPLYLSLLGSALGLFLGLIIYINMYFAEYLIDGTVALLRYSESSENVQ